MTSSCLRAMFPPTLGSEVTNFEIAVIKLRETRPKKNGPDLFQPRPLGSLEFDLTIADHAIVFDLCAHLAVNALAVTANVKGELVLRIIFRFAPEVGCLLAGSKHHFHGV